MRLTCGGSATRKSSQPWRCGQSRTHLRSYCETLCIFFWCTSQTLYLHANCVKRKFRRNICGGALDDGVIAGSTYRWTSLVAADEPRGYLRHMGGGAERDRCTPGAGGHRRMRHYSPSQSSGWVIVVGLVLHPFVLMILTSLKCNKQVLLSASDRSWPPNVSTYSQELPGGGLKTLINAVMVAVATSTGSPFCPRLPGRRSPSCTFGERARQKGFSLARLSPGCVS